MTRSGHRRRNRAVAQGPGALLPGGAAGLGGAGGTAGPVVPAAIALGCAEIRLGSSRNVTPIAAAAAAPAARAFGPEGKWGIVQRAPAGAPCAGDSGGSFIVRSIDRPPVRRNRQTSTAAIARKMMLRIVV
ncbi:MAG: hypothetical protein JWL67_2152 [Solirubrobacterales bacterium]|jgi:hypothetical protein|nr:hypothetical protein [Solirubrobacterales bacterium]